MVEKTKFEDQIKEGHPLGWNCSDCFHVVKDSRPGSNQMKCTAHPPRPHVMLDSRGQITGFMSISPPVNDGEWCSEFNARDITKTQ